MPIHGGILKNSDFIQFWEKKNFQEKNLKICKIYEIKKMVSNVAEYATELPCRWNHYKLFRDHGQKLKKR